MLSYDLEGKVFGSLTAIRAVNHKGFRSWLCECVCATTHTVHTRSLMSGKTTSCGCTRRTRNGKSHTPTYQSWANMRKRCLNEKDRAYTNYGGRGIEVCDRWHDFENFLADMGERPTGLTLERKDNGKGYEPSNCVWATRTEQNRNTRRSALYTYDGITMCEAEWAVFTGISRTTLQQRLRRGWSFERAITTPVR